MTGHPGRGTTLEMVQRHNWWPRLCHFIYEYIAGCATCQWNKVNTHPTQLPTQPIKSKAMKPFQIITQNFISGLPEMEKGCGCIIFMVDHGLLEGVVFIPCSKGLTALEAAELHFNHTFKPFGIPEIIISNRDLFSFQRLTEV